MQIVGVEKLMEEWTPNGMFHIFTTTSSTKSIRALRSPCRNGLWRGRVSTGSKIEKLKHGVQAGIAQVT